MTIAWTGQHTGTHPDQNSAVVSLVCYSNHQIDATAATRSCFDNNDTLQPNPKRRKLESVGPPRHLIIMPLKHSVIMPMDINMTDSQQHEAMNYQHTTANQRDEGSFITPMSTDWELHQFVEQSGAKSYSDVVNLCVAHGVPLSRMLRLDLMRKFAT